MEKDFSEKSYFHKPCGSIIFNPHKEKGSFSYEKRIYGNPNVNPEDVRWKR